MTTQVLAEDKQFLVLIKHSVCYSYSSPVKVLLLIEERKPTIKRKDILSFEKLIFLSNLRIRDNDSRIHQINWIYI